MIQVTATDGDKDRQQNIVYFLTGQGIDPDNPANSKFDINRTTGEIFVLKVSNFHILYYMHMTALKTEAVFKVRKHRLHSKDSQPTGEYVLCMHIAITHLLRSVCVIT